VNVTLTGYLVWSMCVSMWRCRERHTNRVLGLVNVLQDLLNRLVFLDEVICLDRPDATNRVAVVTPEQDAQVDELVHRQLHSLENGRQLDLFFGQPKKGEEKEKKKRKKREKRCTFEHPQNSERREKRRKEKKRREKRRKEKKRREEKREEKKKRKKEKKKERKTMHV
jgi:hypothetical protein